jgi:hypothetical protein
VVVDDGVHAEGGVHRDVAVGARDGEAMELARVALGVEHGSQLVDHVLLHGDAAEVDVARDVVEEVSHLPESSSLVVEGARAGERGLLRVPQAVLAEVKRIRTCRAYCEDQQHYNTGRQHSATS